MFFHYFFHYIPISPPTGRELLEGPATPVKKRMRNALPSPGSVAFNLLDAVTTT